MLALHDHGRGGLDMYDHVDSGDVHNWLHYFYVFSLFMIFQLMPVKEALGGGACLRMYVCMSECVCVSQHS